MIHHVMLIVPFYQLVLRIGWADSLTFLYAWKCFFGPLMVINAGSEENNILMLVLGVLHRRAADSPNLILAEASIAILPPFMTFLMAQRFFVENPTSSGVKE